MTSRINSELLRAMQVYTQQNTSQIQRKNTDQTASAGLPADRVDLSPQGKELAKELSTATRIVRETDATLTSEGRKAKIDELTRRIQLGTYQPPAQEIAARLAPALRALDDDLAK